VDGRALAVRRDLKHPIVFGTFDRVLGPIGELKKRNCFHHLCDKRLQLGAERAILHFAQQDGGQMRTDHASAAIFALGLKGRMKHFIVQLFFEGAELLADTGQLAAKIRLALTAIHCCNAMVEDEGLVDARFATRVGVKVEFVPKEQKQNETQWFQTANSKKKNEPSGIVQAVFKIYQRFGLETCTFCHWWQ